MASSVLSVHSVGGSGEDGGSDGGGCIAGVSDGKVHGPAFTPEMLHVLEQTTLKDKNYAFVDMILNHEQETTSGDLSLFRLVAFDLRCVRPTTS